MAVAAPKRPGALGMLVLAAVAAYTLVWGIWALTSWDDLDGSVFGWNVGYDGQTVTNVVPGRAAALAGIRAGDRIAWNTLPIVGRSNLLLATSVPAGTTLTTTVYRGGQSRTVTLAAVPLNEHEQNATRVGFVAQLILSLMAIALVWLRPSRMTWGFLFFAIDWETQFLAQSEVSRFLLAQGSYALLNGTWAAGLLTFVSRFPKDQPRGALVYLDRIAIPAGVAVASLWLAFDSIVAFSATPPPVWLSVTVLGVLWPLVALIAVAGLVISFATAQGSDRQRILPVLAVVGYLAVTNAVGQYFAFNFTEGPLDIASDALSAGLVALAIAVANGVIRHRVIDVSFTLSRTLVYTVLTTMLVAIFAMIDFVSSKVFEHLGVTLVLEAIAALAFAFSVNAIHHRIDAFVDRVLFRRRHLAEERLNRTARTLAHAENATFIDEALVIEAGDALDLASAAVFRIDGDAYVRVLGAGWDDGNASSISRDDHLIVNLRAELEAVDLLRVRWPRTDLPGDERHPILAIPLVVRHEILGFVLYGGHHGGEAIDPDERRTLVTLAGAAASAYEHLRAKTLLAETKELRRQVSALQEQQTLLREVVDAFKRA